MKYEGVELHNVWDVIPNKGKKEVGLCRLPQSILGKINEGAANMSQLGSACEIRGLLKRGGQAQVVLRAMDDNVVPAMALVYRGDFLHKAVALKIKEPTEIVIDDHPNQKNLEKISKEEGHAFDARLVRVLLPPLNPVNIVSIKGDLAFPPRRSKPSRRILCYGSSITHGASAVFPSGTYAAQCARHLGMDLIDLGVGGSAQMDEPIARHIAGRKDWDVATLEMGINVRSWSPEKFESTVTTFVGTIAARHPDKPIFCIDPFTNDGDYTPKNSEIIRAFRRVLKKVVRRMDSKMVVHVEGKKLLTDSRGLWTDLVHPNDFGMEEMGRKLARLIQRNTSD